MFLKLTNATKEHKGKELLLNSRYIVSVFSIKDDEDNEFTVVYGALQSSWNVEETVEQIMDMLGDEVVGDQ